MTANELLNESLTSLAAKLAEVPTEHFSEIQNIREALAVFDGDEAKSDCFAKNIKELAQAIIDTRKHSSIPLLRTLPVPPYDLWLPFKATNMRGSLDNEDIKGANRIANRVLGALALSARDLKLTRVIEEHEKEDCRPRENQV